MKTSERWDAVLPLAGVVCGGILLDYPTSISIASFLCSTSPAIGREFTIAVFIGNRDRQTNAVGVRVHGKGNLGAKPRDEVLADTLQSINDRRA